MADTQQARDYMAQAREMMRSSMFGNEAEKRIAALLAERDALAAKAAENFAAAVEAQERADALAAKLEQARESLHEIAEEWAGAECGEPVHAQEAYAIGLAKRMYSIAADALAQEPAAPANAPADGNV